MNIEHVMKLMKNYCEDFIPKDLFEDWLICALLPQRILSPPAHPTTLTAEVLPMRLKMMINTILFVSEYLIWLVFKTWKTSGKHTGDMCGLLWKSIRPEWQKLPVLFRKI